MNNYICGEKDFHAKITGGGFRSQRIVWRHFALQRKKLGTKVHSLLYVAVRTLSGSHFPVGTGGDFDHVAIVVPKEGSSECMVMEGNSNPFLLLLSLLS